MIIIDFMQNDELSSDAKQIVFHENRSYSMIITYKTTRDCDILTIKGKRINKSTLGNIVRKLTLAV